MNTLVSLVNEALGILTIIGQAGIVVFIAAYFLSRNFFGVVSRQAGERALLLAFIFALTATLGSLFYSEVAGFEPCKLCWFQRIFMYPQAIILGMALFRKDPGVRIYSLTLSVIGALIAGYHYLLQLGAAPALPCAAVGYSAACSQRFVLQFGYITIPMMAFTAFLMIIVVLAAQKFKASE